MTTLNKNGWLKVMGEVREWAVQNFKGTPVPMRSGFAGEVPDTIRFHRLTLNYAPMPICGMNLSTDLIKLDWLAPLLGISEEIGEFAFAVRTDAMEGADDKDEKFDAIGDICVYICDFTHRILADIGEEAELIMDLIEPDDEFDSSVPDPASCFIDLVAAYGMLSQCVLKRAQMIRGMEDFTFFRSALLSRLGILIRAVDALSNAVTGRDSYSVLEETWAKVVQKRNWVANSANGQV